jgi:hypothetical protein
MPFAFGVVSSRIARRVAGGWRCRRHPAAPKLGYRPIYFKLEMICSRSADAAKSVP